MDLNLQTIASTTSSGVTSITIVKGNGVAGGGSGYTSPPSKC